MSGGVVVEIGAGEPQLDVLELSPVFRGDHVQQHVVRFHPRINDAAIEGIV
jgi:hypothetical protein